ncbi:MAG: TauD/TfdA dioxygenase family protein [Rhodospirillales bacterium]
MAPDTAVGAKTPATKLDIHPLKPVGAEIFGLDLSQNLDDDTIQAVEAALNTYGVIVFRDQDLGPAEQIAFTQRFGDVPRHVRQEYALEGYPEIHLISNIKEGERSIGSAYAGDGWHSDLCFTKTPARYLVLNAKELPRDENGKVLGDTVFASAADAYDSLPQETKDKIDGLRGIQQYHRRQAIKQQQREGDHARPDLTPEQLAKTPDITQPVVRTHEGTGRKCIYVNPVYTFGIEGMEEKDAEPLLKMLEDHIVEPEAEKVYRHTWREGDVVMWDNCLMQHEAITDYALPQRRLMYRTTVKGGQVQ